MFKLRLGKKGQVLKFVVGLIITIFVFFYSFKGIAELAKVGVSSSEKGNFNELTREIKKLAEKGEDGSRANLNVELGSNIKHRIILNYWESYDKFSRSPTNQHEDWYKPDQCKGKDCLCFFLSYNSEKKGNVERKGNIKPLFAFKPKEVSCFEVPDGYYLYLLNNGAWNNFGQSGKFKVSLYKLGNIIFACKDKCIWPNLIDKHPKKHLANNVGELSQEVKKLFSNGTEGQKKNFKLNLGYNRVFLHYPKDSERKPIDYGCSEKFEKKLLYATETKESADLGFGQNTLCMASEFKTESTGIKGKKCGTEKQIIHLTPKGSAYGPLECHSIGNINLTVKNMPAINSFDQKPFTMDLTLEKRGKEILLCKGASC